MCLVAFNYFFFKRRQKKCDVHVILSTELQFSKLTGAMISCCFMWGPTLEGYRDTLPTRFRFLCCQRYVRFKDLVSSFWREHTVVASSFQCLVPAFSEFPLTCSSFISFLHRSLYPLLFSSPEWFWTQFNSQNLLSLPVSLALLFLSVAPNVLPFSGT